MLRLGLRSTLLPLPKTTSPPLYLRRTPPVFKSHREGVYGTVLGLAVAGCLETLYLTTSKFLDVSVACPSSGCDAVIDSAYGAVFGLPLSLIGFLGYSVVAWCAWRCRSASDDDSRKQLLMSSASMASCSGVLIYTLFSRFDGDFCLWCYLSAVLSFSAFFLTLSTIDKDERLTMMMPTSAMAATAALGLILIFKGVDAAEAEDIVIDYKDPIVVTKSTRESVALAKELKKAGVKMFGAFWCNHCYDQKTTFGKEAMEFFPYVECFPDGYRKGIIIAKECQREDIKGYPTWVFGDKLISGEQSIDTLKQELEDFKSIQ